MPHKPKYSAGDLGKAEKMEETEFILLQKGSKVDLCAHYLKYKCFNSANSLAQVLLLKRGHLMSPLIFTPPYTFEYRHTWPEMRNSLCERMSCFEREFKNKATYLKMFFLSCSHFNELRPN